MLAFFGFNSSKKAPPDRRRAPREPIRLPATIILSAKKSLCCETLDLSSGGARLDLPGDRILPQEFDLHIPARRVKRRAKLVWRDRSALGVQFV